MSKSAFYLGRAIDPDGTERTSSAASPRLTYNPDDLTTHAVVVGMTGSGKTGLLIDLLEEAALSGLPSIVIDPKGDLTNLLLHFPAQKPADFQPWIDPESARRAGKDTATLAADTAQRWTEGLAAWELGPSQLEQLQAAVDYVVYTPGSSAGEPVNLLASFVPPAGLNWQEHREILRERIAATATALLGLVGLKDIDPLRSREHILLCNIIESAWARGAPLDLTELILQVQNPPFERLGAFAINNFFPEKERLSLALLLNNFLAAPSFQSWLEGEPLDVEDFLTTPSGKPRMSIFYLAHLDESERMFFVTLLLASLETWMRAQRGSPGLRALLAFDEIGGYLPPTANPPSRPVLLRLLKQARAFGLGLILASQNPVDLDYKGLSNAGTWFVGRLQTEQDKDRLLDGLQSIDGGVDRRRYTSWISGLRPRTFLLHNIHAGQQIFETRWSLNYLAGPLTRAQLGDLKALGSAPEQPPQPSEVANALTAPARAAQDGYRPLPLPNAAAAPGPGLAPQPRAAATTPPIDPTSLTPPAPPAGVQVLFAAPALSVHQAFAQLGESVAGPVQPQGMVYQPVLLFQGESRCVSRRYGLDYTVKRACLVRDAAVSRLDWDAAVREPLDPRALDAQPLPGARFSAIPAWLANPRLFNAAQKDFADWLYRKGTTRIYANEALKLYSTPEDNQATFRQQCAESARQNLKSDSERVEAAFAIKLNALARKMDRQQAIVGKYEDEVDRRRMEEMGTNFELIFSIFSRRKRSLSHALSKGRLTSSARAELEAADQALDSLQAEYKDLEAQKNAALKESQERWARAVGTIDEVPLTPLRKDIYIEVAALVWVPVYLLQAEGRILEAIAI